MIGKYWATTTVALVLALAVYAQQADSTANSTNNPVFRVSSTLVQVDAVVTDSKGRQVTNLTPDDFELYADGKLQAITSFSFVGVSGTTGANAAQPKVGNPLLAPPPVLSVRREDIRRTIVLMVDDLNLSFESLAWVRRSLLAFVDQQMQPGDLIALCRTGYGSSALQQFTSDRRLARAAISSLRWNPNGGGSISFFQSIKPDAKIRGPVGPASAEGTGSDVPVFDSIYSLPSPKIATQLDGLRKNSLTVGALGAIDSVIQGLRDMPGRKSLVLFSDGFNLESADGAVQTAMHRLADRANRSGTVIYTMQGVGLVTLQPGAADNPSSPGRSSGATVAEISKDRSKQLYNAQIGLEYLSRVTGGFSHANGNDLNGGLARVLEDQSGYYLLGYKPPAGTFDENGGDRPYHNLKVRVKTKGLTVRSRTGFFGATDEETTPQAASALEQLRLTMLSPFQSSAIRLRLTPIYAEVAGQGPVVRNLLDVDLRDLTFRTLPDGSSEAQLKLLVVAFTADSTQTASFTSDYKIDLAAGKLEEARRNGALYVVEIKPPKPGGFQIRTAVRDEATQATGSAHAFVEVADARKNRLALTSVVLANGSAIGSPDSATLGFSAARRQFRHGDILNYFCLLENADNKKTAAADVNAQIRIVAGGKQVYLAPLAITELAGNKRALSGQLRIGSALPLGDYFLQIIASANGSRKPVIVDQWTDFQVQP